MSVLVCGIDHDDATCMKCGTEHVKVGWAHVCEPCFEGFSSLSLEDFIALDEAKP